MKDLPKMYHNRIDKDISNNRKVFSTINSKIKDIYIETKEKITGDKKNYTVEQKIYNIFNSKSKYI